MKRSTGNTNITSPLFHDSQRAKTAFSEPRLPIITKDAKKIQPKPAKKSVLHASSEFSQALASTSPEKFSTPRKAVVDTIPFQSMNRPTTAFYGHTNKKAQYDANKKLQGSTPIRNTEPVQHHLLQRGATLPPPTPKCPPSTPRVPLLHIKKLMDLSAPVTRPSTVTLNSNIRENRASTTGYHNTTNSLNNICCAPRNYTSSVSRFSKRDQIIEEPTKKNVPIQFMTTQESIRNQRKEQDMVAVLDSCTNYEDAPIWLCFRLWDYEQNFRQLKEFMTLKNVECRGDEIYDMKKLFDFHGMSSCLDCFMLDGECNMRNVGYIIDDDVLISFNNILPYMTQYFVELRDRFYGTTPAQNALIRQWINYCVRNVRGRRISEYMWDEMDFHLGIDGFFGGTYRTMADTLMYVSLYNRIKLWNAQEFGKRYNLANWFRLMQMDDKLRGANQRLHINRSSKLHPNYHFYIKPDPVEL